MGLAGQGASKRALQLRYNNRCKTLTARDDHIFGVSEDTLHLALSGGSDGGVDFLKRSGLLESASEIDNGNVGGGHSEGHTGEFAVELGDDL